MADNFTLLSTYYPLAKEKHERAAEIMGPVAIQWLRDEDYPEGCIDEETPLNSSISTRIEFDRGGIWFVHGETADSYLVALLISALRKEFAGKDDKPFVFGYCFMCSKPRIDEFGGGAYAILPDGKVLHCNPEDTVLGQANTILLRRRNSQRRKR